MIPCIENKCILLPTCKYRNSIICEQLEQYISIRNNGSHNPWREVRKVIPDLSIVQRADKVDQVWRAQYHDPLFKK